MSQTRPMRHATLIALAATAQLSVAQDYLAGDPVWLQTSVCAAPAPCIATDGHNYYTAGDSIINGITWTKVVRTGVVSYSWQSTPPVAPGCQGLHPYGTGAHGTWLVRQQDRQLRIWVNDADELLHEFDLQLGSTVPISYTNWNTDITVIAVDSVLIGTEMRARYELGNSWAQYLIEGVGSSHGLFEPLANFLECGYSLNCFGLGDMDYYPEEWEGGCWLVMGTGAAYRAPALTLSPNPSADEAMLSGLEAGTEVRVLDACGRVVLREQATSGRLVLSLGALNEGCYVVQAAGRTSRLVVAR